MKICVMGAGVIGLTTAWWLAKRGFDVAIVDRAAHPGEATSFANGAQLSYAFVAPLASPDTLRKLPGLLLSRAAPIRINPGFDPNFIRWGFDFLRACTDTAVQATTAAQLALAALSRAELATLSETQQLAFGLRTAGKLIVYRKAASFGSARKQIALQSGLGNAQDILSAAECLTNEPALRIPRHALAGGTYSKDEQVADCRLFCDELSERLRRLNSVSWFLETEIEAPIVRAGHLNAIATSQGAIEADTFVLSTASQASVFARAAGFRLPIMPMKGYSITLEPRSAAAALRHSVTDFDNKIVFAPLFEQGAPRIRAAGIADLVGNDTGIDEKRMATIVRLTAENLDVDTAQDLHPWAGLRPATPDSRPVIGWSPLKGLFLNTGHGALGWTLACGSARLTADLLTGETPAVEPRWFSLGRV